MNEAKYTPEPWEVDTTHLMVDGELVIARWRGGPVICVVWPFDDDPGEERQKANARLIAAAPELVEALEGVVALVECGVRTSDYQAILNRARTAIAMAKGGAQ